MADKALASDPEGNKVISDKHVKRTECRVLCLIPTRFQNTQDSSEGQALQRLTRRNLVLLKQTQPGLIRRTPQLAHCLSPHGLQAMNGSYIF